MLRTSLFCAALLTVLAPGGLTVAAAADQPSTSNDYVPTLRGAPDGRVGGGSRLSDGPAMSTDAMPHYVPPMRGAPGGRTGGGSRGIKGSDLTIAVLAPDHVGLTAEDQPTLYWYAS